MRGRAALLGLEETVLGLGCLVGQLTPCTPVAAPHIGELIRTRRGRHLLHRVCRIELVGTLLYRFR